MELVRYNINGEEVSRRFINSPNEHFINVEMLDMTYAGESAYLFVSFSNDFTKRFYEGELMAGEITDGQSKFSSLGRDSKRRIISGLIRYNKVTKSVVYVFTEFAFSNKTSENFATRFGIVKPESGGESKPILYESTALNAIYKKVFGKKYGYQARPENLYIHEDGNFSIVSHLKLHKVVSFISSPTRLYGSPNNNNSSSPREHSSNATAMGPVAVITYS